VNARELVSVAGGRIASGDADLPIGSVSIDSRTTAPGDLFFAIRGERFDGHDFVPAAFSAGAAGAVISHDSGVGAASHGGRLMVIVEDTTRALQALASEVRRRSSSKVVAITGSAGKTTTKDVTAEFLASRYRVYRSSGNLNNHIGLPLALMGLGDRPDIAVLELGMNHAGEISTLVGIAAPDVRVWTNVAAVHAEFFPSVEAIADAKAEIMEGATPEGILVANGDDPLVMARAGRFPGRLVTFGVEKPATVSATDVEELGLEGMQATLVAPAGRALLRTPLLGRAALFNILAATAVATVFEVPLADVVARAANLRPSGRRGEIHRLPGGIVLIDDSYNSNPRALERALEVLSSDRTASRRVAVLGEMLELGEQSPAMHEACGRAAAGSGLGLLIAVGGEPARRLSKAAIESGMPADTVWYVRTSQEAAPLAASVVKSGDLVLVKGSRGIRTELVADRLKVEHS
jgi:UDP-N-acetylmuramoyl-tripeptide--D-alanyl-D-alanine ligase